MRGWKNGFAFLLWGLLLGTTALPTSAKESAKDWQMVVSGQQMILLDRIHHNAFLRRTDAWNLPLPRDSTPPLFQKVVDVFPSQQGGFLVLCREGGKFGCFHLSTQGKSRRIATLPNPPPKPDHIDAAVLPYLNYGLHLQDDTILLAYPPEMITDVTVKPAYNLLYREARELNRTQHVLQGSFKPGYCLLYREGQWRKVKRGGDPPRDQNLQGQLCSLAVSKNAEGVVLPEAFYWEYRHSSESGQATLAFDLRLDIRDLTPPQGLMVLLPCLQKGLIAVTDTESRRGDPTIQYNKMVIFDRQGKRLSWTRLTLRSRTAIPLFVVPQKIVVANADWVYYIDRDRRIRRQRCTRYRVPPHK